MEQRIGMISLGVDDLAVSRSFYETGLGFSVLPASNDNVVFMQMNGLLLGLYGHDELAKDAEVEANRSSFRGFAVCYMGRDRDEVDRVMALAERAGATITKTAQDVFWGGYSGYFADPDGFLWEIAHNPFIEMTDEGNIIA